MHPQNSHVAGRTLIEMLTALTVIAVLTTQGHQHFPAMMARQASTTQINWLVGAIHYTRHAAVTRKATVTLCPGSPHSTGCEGDWEDGLIAFTDHNEDAQINEKDTLIQYMAAVPTRGTFTWRSFRRRRYLQMTELGYTNYQSGNFVFCPYDQTLIEPRQIILNAQGRVRINRRRNKAGQVVDTRGRPLRC